jgi:uncharacterized protein
MLTGIWESRTGMHADLPVRVTPRSSRNKLVLDSDNNIRAWVTASPTDGQANEAVCELLASALGIAKSRVTLVKGQTSRQKLLCVEGMSVAGCLDLLKVDD